VFEESGTPGNGLVIVYGNKRPLCCTVFILTNSNSIPSRATYEIGRFCSLVDKDEEVFSSC
jgi:hypothetical protein